MANVKKIPREFGQGLEKTFGRNGAMYFKEIVDSLNSKIDEINNATTGNIAIFDSDGRLSDAGEQPSGLEGDLSGSRIVYSDSSLTLKSVLDLTAWVAVSLGLTATDNGDGTMTLEVKQQSHISNASSSHTITDPGDLPASVDALRDDLVANAIPDIESALDALGSKINAVMAALETAEIFASS